MKTFFQSWFSKKNNIAKAHKEEPLNQLIFALTKNGDLSIEIMLENNSVKDSVYLAKLLYEINDGSHAKDIFKLLLDVSNNNKSYTTMINNTLELLSVYYVKNEITQPVISPSQFYNAEK